MTFNPTPEEVERERLLSVFEKYYSVPGPDQDDHSLSLAFAELRREGFAEGAVWAQAQLTPTREQIAKAIFMTDYEHMGSEAWEAARLDGNNDRQDAFMKADAVLALLQAQAGRDGT